MFFKKSSEYGRSMIEMLGVLAIVGILSVGAIAGFQKAMMKHKINKLTEQYTLFIQEYLLLYRKDWRRVYQEKQQRVLLAPYMAAMGLPAGWKIKSTDSQFLLDSLGYSVVPFSSVFGVAFDFYIRQAGENSNSDYELCRQFFLNVIKPFENDIHHVFLYQANNSAPQIWWYGIPYCNEQLHCLANLKLDDVLDFCQRCSTADNTDRCVIAAYF
ncbi:MAG: type II secretion system protein [Alphaproteobacteria bacterium]|nr:type II secretion system protein [Alphaproteobacteria bacterium]